jgi:hypothetical protein
MITYVGNCEFEQFGSRVWSKTSTELDSMVETYRGRADKLDAFILSINVNTVHPIFKGMAVKRIVGTDNDPVFPTVSVEFQGFMSGAPRAPIYRNTLSLQTVQSSAQIAGVGKCSIEAQFYAPVGETEWWQIGPEPDPDTPLYAAVKTKKQNLVAYLVRFHITDENGATATSASLSDVVAVLNSLQNTEQLQQYEYEPVVANYVWHCRSSVLKTLQGT